MIDNHRKSTLLNYTKEDLAAYCLTLEQNISNLKASFEVQYANCMKIVEDMNLLNEGLKKAREQG